MIVKNTDAHAAAPRSLDDVLLVRLKDFARGAFTRGGPKGINELDAIKLNSLLKELRAHTIKNTKRPLLRVSDPVIPAERTGIESWRAYIKNALKQNKHDDDTARVKRAVSRIKYDRWRFDAYNGNGVVHVSLTNGGNVHTVSIPHGTDDSQVSDIIRREIMRIEEQRVVRFFSVG